MLPHEGFDSTTDAPDASLTDLAHPVGHNCRHCRSVRAAVKTPSFSQILRKLMSEAQGRVTKPPVDPLTKKAKRKANRERNLVAAIRLAA